MNDDFTIDNSSAERFGVFTFKEATIDGFTPSSIPCYGMVMKRISRQGTVKQENCSDKIRKGEFIQTCGIYILIPPTEIYRHNRQDHTFAEVPTLDHEVLHDSVEHASFVMKRFLSSFTNAFLT